MYLEDGVFQSEIAKYYQVSPTLVSRLVKEAQHDPAKNAKLKVEEAERKKMIEAVKRVVTGMLENNVPIVRAEAVVKATQ